MSFARALALKLCSAISVVIATLLAIMTLVMCGLVITRYGFSFSPRWSEEVARYAMVWCGMLGASVLTLFDDHIALSYITSKLGPNGRRIQTTLTRLLIIGASAVLVYTSWKFTVSQLRVQAPGSHISMAIPTASILVAAVLGMLFQILRLAQDLFQGSQAAADMDAHQAIIMDTTFKFLQE